MERRGERRSEGQINDMTILTSTRQLLYLGGERTGTGTEEAVSPFSYRCGALYHLHPYPYPHRIPIYNEILIEVSPVVYYESSRVSDPLCLVFP